MARAAAPDGSGPGPRALVVLGAAVRADGAPSPALLRRARAGLRLWHAGGASLILASGGRGKGRDEGPTEAGVIARLLREGGVPEAAILTEDRSRTTAENAAFSAPILRAAGASEVILVTDRAHGPRARLAFRQEGMAAVSVAADRDGPRPPLRARLKRGAAEGAGWIACRMRYAARAARRPEG